MDDADNTDLSELRRAVLYKVGRNLLEFQRIEACLKFMLANSRASGTLAEFVQRKNEHVEKVMKQMLGKLVQQFADDLLGDAQGESAAPENLNEPWLGFSFRFGLDEKQRESVSTRLSDMLLQRK